MKLKDRKLEKKEDYQVFKILLRCLKESKFGEAKRYSFSGNDFSRLIESCYLSRRSHYNEEQFTNYSYWPSDCGRILGDGAFLLLYYSLIVIMNNKPNLSVENHFISQLKDLTMNSPIYNKEKISLLPSYGFIINEAANKIDKLQKSKETDDWVSLISSVAKGIENEIPF